MNNQASTIAQMNCLRRLVAIAMRAQDDFVLQFVYQDRKGKRTRRVVSPIRFFGYGNNEQFSALCLCREEVRQFVLARCSDPVLLRAFEVLMPITIEVLQEDVGNE